MSRDLAAATVVEKRGDRQVALAGRHRCRQHRRAPARWRQHRSRQQEALAHQIAKLGNPGVGHEIAALDIDMGDADAPTATEAILDGLCDLVAWPHEILAGAY